MRQRLSAPFSVAVLVILLTGAGALGAETIDREYRERFDVAVGDSLELHFGDGDVVVASWDDDVLEIHARYHAEQRAIGFSTHDRRDFTVDFERLGDVVRVVGREPGGRVGIGVFTNRTHEYVYTVRAPSYLALDLRGEDGDVRIEGWESAISLVSEDGDLELFRSAGDLRLRLEDGDARIEEHEGSLDLRLEDGDVEIVSCAGEEVTIEVEDGDVELSRCEAALSVQTSDGDVYLDRVRAARVDVRTDDGDAYVDVDWEGAIEIGVRTGDGNVDLDLGPGVSARFTIDTDDGTIRVDGPSAELSHERRYASGTIGSGDGTVHVRTDDGSVTLRQVETAGLPAEREGGR